MASYKDEVPVTKNWGKNPQFWAGTKLFITQINNDLVENTAKNCQHALYNKTPIQQVNVVGIIVNLVKKQDYIKYTIDDGTGLIGTTWWLADLKGNVRTAPHNFTLGDHVRIFANLKLLPPLDEADRKRELTIRKMEILEDLNEELWFWAQVIELSQKLYDANRENKLTDSNPNIKANEVSAGNRKSKAPFASSSSSSSAATSKRFKSTHQGPVSSSFALECNQIMDRLELGNDFNERSSPSTAKSTTETNRLFREAIIKYLCSQVAENTNKVSGSLKETGLDTNEFNIKTLYQAPFVQNFIAKYFMNQKKHPVAVEVKRLVDEAIKSIMDKGYIYYNSATSTYGLVTKKHVICPLLYVIMNYEEANENPYLTLNQIHFKVQNFGKNNNKRFAAITKLMVRDGLHDLIAYKDVFEKNEKYQLVKKLD